MKKFKKITLGILVLLEAVFIILFVTISALICQSISWMFDTWQHLTMSELMYQLNAPATGTNSDIIYDYIITCIPVAVLCLLACLVIFIGIRKSAPRLQLTSISLFLTAVVVLGVTLNTAYTRLDVKAYTSNQNTYSTFIDKNYVSPADVDIRFPEQKRNLIYIYLESMETTYSDTENGGAYAENYIPELTALAQENEDFSGADPTLNGGHSLYCTTWTSGALFAQTSGLPLIIPIEGSSMNTQDTFFPGILNLGDLLEREGYTQTFLIGSDAEFGGRKLYFTQHGNYNIRDYYYYQQMGKFPEDYWVWWGYEDARLFEHAKEELLLLSQQEQPFNLTMLTVDTHFEDGYPCDQCTDQYGDNRYANVISCSSRQVMDFVRWIQQQDFYENTTIIVSGDHPTMDSDFCQDIDASYDRKVYTTYINSAVQPADPEQRRQFSTFDSFPTTLASIGAEIEGNRLGLGTNLFSADRTLLELYGIDYVDKELQRKSKLMDDLTVDIIDKSKIPVPAATVAPLTYDYRTSILPVSIYDIQEADNGISAINMAVWTNEDQSDLQWINAELQEDGSYMGNISVPSFGYKTGEYHIDVYLIDNQENQYLIASALGYV